MKSKEMAAYVPLVQEMADLAIAFLAEQELGFPAAYPMPELRLSLEKRVKVHGIYNKRNVLGELRRLQSSFAREMEQAEEKESLLCAMDFLESLALFLTADKYEDCGLGSWLKLEQQFGILEGYFPGKADVADLGVRLKLWQQLVRLYAKLQQLEIKQQLSGVFSSEGRITLYMNNIEEICRKQGFDMESYLQSVLVHEYTHACHYAAFMEVQMSIKEEPLALERAMLRWSGAYFGKGKVTAVKESLARYVQLLWCKKNDPDLAEAMKAEEYGEFVIYPNWPYAGAQALLCLQQQEARLLFNSMWQSSLVDWEQAYELLGASINRVK